MHTDVCEFPVLEVIRGVCRDPTEAPCGLIGEPCCGGPFDSIFGIGGDCDDPAGASVCENWFNDASEDDDYSGPFSCIACGGAGQPPCVGASPFILSRIHT